MVGQSASVMTFAVYALSQHPTVLARVRKEILDKLGYRPPTVDDIKDLKYLRAFLNGSSSSPFRKTLFNAFVISETLR